MFVLSSFTFTHLVAQSMATIIYLLLVNRPIGLIGPTKSKAHFINGSFGKTMTNLTRLSVIKPPTHW
jgi:hypothetical protein